MLPKDSHLPGWTAIQDSDGPDSRRGRPTITSHTGSQATARANEALQPVDRTGKLAQDITPESALLSTVSDHPKQANSESGTIVWMVYALVGLFLTFYFGSLLLRRGGQHWVWLDGWAVCGVELVAGGLCLARGWARRPGRAAALILGAGILSWSAGDITLTIESLGGASPPTPSLADLFYLGFYPLAYIALVTFVRGAVGKLGTSNWMDGAIAGLGAAAACSAFALPAIQKSTGGNALATATSLAYPVGDVLLLGLVVGGFALLSGRRKSSWILLGSGMALNVVGDTSNLFQNTLGASSFGVILNAIAWPTAVVLMSTAVWLKGRPANLLAEEKPSWFVLPNLAAAASIVILFTGSLVPVGRAALVLATLTLLLSASRLALSLRTVQGISRHRQHQALTDDLTGLHNRRHLFRVLHAYFTEQAETSTVRSLAFLFVDLNRFKEINDSFGHPAGDELLRQLGSRLSGALRETDFLVRHGGDEFAVLLVDGTLEHAIAVAQRITTSLAEPFYLDRVSASINASIGIAMAPADAVDASGLVACADVAMYRAKLGNKPYACYEQMLDVDGDHLRLLEELRIAIDDDQLVLHYQPQLDLRTGEISAVEALVRWAHPRLGLLPPIRFLPLAEEAGYMGAITRWVLAEAASQCAVWRRAGRRMSVALNVSPSTLLEPGFVEGVKERLQHHHLPAGALVLEVTENCVIADFETARRVIEELRDLGLVVSIDDFGAGATSLAYLSNLAVGELKLDRAFVAGLMTGDRERELDLVRSTIELGHAIGLRIVAEGIEDPETLDLLSELGCDLAQGYCISMPKPAGELAFRSHLVTGATIEPHLEDLAASA